MSKQVNEYKIHKEGGSYRQTGIVLLYKSLSLCLCLSVSVSHSVSLPPLTHTYTQTGINFLWHLHFSPKFFGQSFSFGKQSEQTTFIVPLNFRGFSVYPKGSAAVPVIDLCKIKKAGLDLSNRWLGINAHDSSWREEENDREEGKKER